MDLQTKNLNKLCRLTPEGYMIMIEQRQFEGRDQTQTTNVEKATNTLKMQSLSKEVEKIFQKVCQSIELYKAENIPIITEFLEF